MSSMPDTPIAKPRFRIVLASPAEREAICRARHDVYAVELGQYPVRPDGVLRDAPEVASLYLAAFVGPDLAGFVGITPPSSPRFSVDRYLPRPDIPVAFDAHLFEIRALTVLPPWRGSLLAGLLMYAAFRWVEAHAGARVLAIGRHEVVDLYLRAGMQRLGRSFPCGAVTYELLSATVADIGAAIAPLEAVVQRYEALADWQLDIAFRHPAECFHGGAFFAAIGEEFDDLSRCAQVINADVLDAWFPPAPEVMRLMTEHLEWLIRTSPPTHAEGVTRAIARARSLDPACVLPGGGSSPLIFLALQRWLKPTSRVLLLDPTYGEYGHIVERVIRCRMERLVLDRADGYVLDPARLAARSREGFDLVIWVNPNNPTGRHVPKPAAIAMLRAIPSTTRVWIDETYVDYAGPDESLEGFAAATENVVVCKSLSKVCALSGLRAGYLSGPAFLLEELRSLCPPWALSLPAQMAAVCALRDPAYYAGRYAQTRELRERLVQDLRRLGIDEIIPSVTNFILFHLPASGPDAASVVEACRRQGLFLRTFDGAACCLGDRALRIAVKDAATNHRMLQILSEVLARG